MKTIKIELRYDPETDEKGDIVVRAAKMAAKHLWTQALLLGDKRKPQIALYGSDFFTGDEEISLADDITQEAEETNSDGGSQNPDRDLGEDAQGGVSDGGR